MDLFDHSLNLLPLERLKELFVSPVQFKKSLGSFGLILHRPQSSLSHLRIQFCVFVFFDVVTVNLVASELCQSLAEEVDADVFAFENDVTDLDLSSLPFNNKRKIFA
jgi:hypothetical protein